MVTWDVWSVCWLPALKEEVWNHNFVLCNWGLYSRDSFIQTGSLSTAGWSDVIDVESLCKMCEITTVSSQRVLTVPRCQHLATWKGATITYVSSHHSADIIHTVFGNWLRATSKGLSGQAKCQSNYRVTLCEWRLKCPAPSLEAMCGLLGALDWKSVNKDMDSHTDVFLFSVLYFFINLSTSVPSLKLKSSV